MQYILENQPSTINGAKVARQNLAEYLYKTEVAPRLLEFNLESPHYVTILLNLSCVWNWNQENRATFWDIFRNLLDLLVMFCRNSAYDPDIIPQVENPMTWNMDTW